MKTSRNRKNSNGLKNVKSKMTGLPNSSKDISKKIINQKNKQQKTIRSIKDELKKLNQFFISLEGLQNLSDASIKNIHNRREKVVLELIRLTADLSVTTRELKKLQEQYRHASKL